ncbi:MAG TPA: flagellar basal body P-ring formation chaperone FlgA [Pseudomonadales bacterium]|nr:flagellar basal body P-ring formation chaperone FlgA [Pseudomonadales bacterium]
MIIRHNLDSGNQRSPVVNFIFRPGSLLALFFVFIGALHAAEPPALQLEPIAEVTGDGVFLQQLVKSSQPLPSLRLCDAPQIGATANLSRAQINDLLTMAAPDLATTNWTGANQIRILRRTHTLNEADLVTLLTTTLQQDYVKDEGQLDLNLTQPWNAPVVPDEPLMVKILEVPTAGVTRSFIARFQLCTATEIVGIWDVTLQAHIWREVWVAHSDLPRGELLADADVTRDRRDVLATREMLADFSPGDTTLEIANSVPANGILLARDLKLRTVIHRGQVADAIVEDGALNITMKVQALEDGAPGQTIRARNTVSLHDLTGKVIDEHTIQISL